MERMSITQKIVLAAIFIMFIFIAELIIRLNPSFYCVGYMPSRDSKIVYELYPNYKGTLSKANINRQGLNDRYFPLKKPSNTFRIAVVGDSTSFGLKVGAKNSFPKVLEKKLNKNTKDKIFEVINFSVPGYNISQEYRLIKKKVIRFNPDMVILIFCENDVNMCNYFKPKITFLNYLYNRSFLVHFLLRRIDLKIKSTPQYAKNWKFFKKNILGMFYYDQIIYPYPGLEEVTYGITNPPKIKERVPVAYWYMLDYNNYQIHLANIDDLLKRRGIKFVSSGFFTKKAFDINQKLKIKHVTNLKEIFELNRMTTEELSIPQDGHLNVRGHALAAEFLYNFLNNENLL